MKIWDRLDDRFAGKRVYQFAREFLFRFSEDRVPEVGAQLAYYLLMSFFPFVIFLLSLLTFTSLAQEAVMEQLLGFLPPNSRELLEPIILDLVDNRSTAVLSVALLFSLWSGSNGMRNLMRAMDNAFDVKARRNPLLQRLFSVLYTLFLAIMIVLTLLGQVFGNQILTMLVTQFGLGHYLDRIISLSRVLLPFLMMIFGFALLYQFGPGFPKNGRIRFRQALFGGLLAAIGWTAVSTLFQMYVNNFGRYAIIYGSLGGIIALLVWLFLSSVMLMLGAEFTATWVAIKQGNTRMKSPEARRMDREIKERDGRSQ